MLKQYTYRDLSADGISQLIRRNTDQGTAIREKVQEIVEEVRMRGDAALTDFAARFDGVSLNSLYIDKSEFSAFAGEVSGEQKRALETAYANIERFHKSQLKQEEKVETMPGVSCWRETRAIERVGLYVPGGSAVLPSTFLMLGIPAKLAGCDEIVVCSPPQKNGRINGYIAYCALLLGIDRVYLAGGAQAVAAMAFGTESIPKTDKIFGPGNQYVTMAKTLVQSASGTAIDMPAGPSEVLVIADDTADPEFVAADLLAQAEHGADSQAVLVTTSPALAARVSEELEKQLPVLPRAETAAKSLAGSFILLTGTTAEAMDFSNNYAPEHLLIQTADCEELSTKVKNAGSVFIGNLTPESAGDYASGTNHTLPTSGFARSYSGVSVDSFLKKITFQQINTAGIRSIGKTVEVLAELEGLQAHRNAMSVRLQKLNSQN